MVETRYHDTGLSSACDDVCRPPNGGGIADQLSVLDRFLPLWILLSAGAGIGLGQVSAVHSFIESTTVGSMNLLVGAGLLAMMYPPLANVQWQLVSAVFRDWRLLLLTTIQNWVVGPFLMFLLAAGFFHDDAGFMTGFSLVGCSRCIGMVMIWIALAGGDLEYGAALIACHGDRRSFSRARRSPYLRWVFLRRWKGDDWYFNKFTPRLDLLAVAALLFTIVVLFASQSQRITTTFDSVLFSMVPFIFYFVVMFTGSFFMSQTCGATHAHSVTLAFTATSNNYELSLGVAVATFGLDSDPAMMSVVAALIEIPTMLALVYLSLWLETKSRNTNRQLSLTSPKELAIEPPSFLQS
ncbi:hypothetical protein PC119_g20305 [Phytophthora cactorum]|uniref:Arsenical-resistance protein n=1 Tax=Phytophthora cactorum TaxID=29920 RepID=A0A8T1BP65_9STRA|nr:hypothetical protein PC113_g19053 [Phytophthora cactorum]KAG2906024.1 hypothetical protein PC117_g20612 [Phytophthora cactorum]KAG2984793.1 hypothetical protein PC119_g20305 [Phytophthora cactorum]KAG3063145.1 hypothetical protein PC122_g18980 [Phytophthora cactorum]KAG3137135.1 hypothetical protein C6341_g21114 [Phytophthora cactorum]